MLVEGASLVRAAIFVHLAAKAEFGSANVDRPSVAIARPSVAIARPSVAIPRPSVAIPRPSVAIPRPPFSVPGVPRLAPNLSLISHPWRLEGELLWPGRWYSLSGQKAAASHPAAAAWLLRLQHQIVL